jgi:hypothetical protein
MVGSALWEDEAKHNILCCLTSANISGVEKDCGLDVEV